MIRWEMKRDIESLNSETQGVTGKSGRGTPLFQQRLSFKIRLVKSEKFKSNIQLLRSYFFFFWKIKRWQDCSLGRLFFYWITEGNLNLHTSLCTYPSWHNCCLKRLQPKMEISKIFWTLKSAFQHPVVTAAIFKCDLQADGKNECKQNCSCLVSQRNETFWGVTTSFI